MPYYITNQYSQDDYTHTHDGEAMINYSINIWSGPFETKEDLIDQLKMYGPYNYTVKVVELNL